MAEECKPPSAIDKPGASELGDRIEEIIRGDYCQSKGGCILFPFEGHQDFVDIRELGNVGLFLSFIKANNRQVDLGALERQFRIPGAKNRIPDIVTHQRGRFEFYEIKPNSNDGVRKGQEKVFFMLAFCEKNKLPYVPGTSYRGGSIVLDTATLGPFEFVVRLRWFRKEPGLIVYEVCTERRKRRTVTGDIKLDILLGEALILLGLFGLKELSKGGGLQPIPGGT